MMNEERFKDLPARLRQLTTRPGLGTEIATCHLLEAAALKIEAVDRGEDRRRPIFSCGQKVVVGGVIRGVVEEVIFARNMTDPLYLVEWWHDGDLRGRRFHEFDLETRE